MSDFYNAINGRTPYRLLFILFTILFVAACQTAPPVLDATVIQATPPATLTPTAAPPPIIESSPLPTAAPDPTAVPLETAAPEATAVAEPTPEPEPEAEETNELLLGESAEGRPLIAYRHGNGPLSLLLVGENDAAAAQLTDLHEWLTADPTAAPAAYTLWLLPNWNPDGREISLAANARRTHADCANISASPMAGDFPFSEPESRALRPLAEQMWLVLFWQTSAGGQSIVAAGCPNHIPSQAWAAQLAEAHSFGQRPGGMTVNNWAAHLARRDTAVASLQLGDDCPLACQQRLLADLNIDPFVAEAAGYGVNLTWADEGNSGVWAFAPHSWTHPLAVSRDGTNVYLLDSGQVWALPLADPAAGWPLLRPGDRVDEVVVQEPLDLARLNGNLLILDRVGDVYECVGGTAACRLDRYDRPIGTTSSHFYVALSGSGDTRYLLETSYAHVLRYQEGQPDRARPLSAVLQVDVSGWQERIYVLSRNERRQGELVLFTEAGRSNVFRINAPLYRPRQIQATATAVYVLDQAGRRLLVLHPDNGRVQRIIRLRGQEPISSFYVDDDGRLLLATAGRLYFLDEPGQNALVNAPVFDGVPVFDGAPVFDGRPSHNETILHDLVGLAKPIAGSPLTQRPIQLPGAPRHYRLGVHEGLDFYWHVGTAVYAVADGRVIRADYDYVPPTEWQYWAWREEAQRLTYTSETAHDVFRGRQIWIAHENGTISRYAHLSSIGGGLAVGTAVSQGQYIGAVGNSGSPLSLEGPDGDAHLHLEIWVGGYFLGQFLRPIEIMEWLEEIFP